MFRSPLDLRRPQYIVRKVTLELDRKEVGDMCHAAIREASPIEAALNVRLEGRAAGEIERKSDTVALFMEAILESVHEKQFHEKFSVVHSKKCNGVRLQNILQIL